MRLFVTAVALGGVSTALILVRPVEPAVVAAWVVLLLVSAVVAGAGWHASVLLLWLVPVLFSGAGVALLWAAAQYCGDGTCADEAATYAGFTGVALAAALVLVYTVGAVRAHDGP